MKNQALTLVGVLSLLLTGSALAQSHEIRANVPFNFVVNRTTMPAGAYTISTLSAPGETLLIRGVESKTIKLVNANYAQSNRPSARTRLVFRCYGTRYFLSQVWTEGSVRGRQFPKSAAESEVAMDFTPHDVILAASLR